MDSFDYYSTTEVTRKWSVMSGATIDVDSRTGSGALRMTNFNVSASVGLDSQPSWIVGAAFKTNSLGNVQPIFKFIDDTTIQCTLRLNVDGTLEIVRSTGTSVSGGVSIATLTTGTYFYIEWKVTISNSIAADTGIVRVDGSEVINVDAGEDLQISVNSTANIFQIAGGSATTNLWDDLYVFDGTGSENNDFIGDAFVAAQFPDGNGTTNDFNGSDGNSVDNYLLVDEALTDDDVTYTESSTPGDIDLYTFDNLTASPNIKAVQLNSVIRKDEIGARTIRTVTRPASTNFFGASKAPSAISYLNEIEILDQNPETAANWTKQDFNATEFGVEIET